jgi:2-hydroxychromene-2-carboxylate isomerase
VQEIEFYYDLVSPYSYLAHTQLPGLSERTGARVMLRPVLLGGVHQATGNQAPIATPAKAAYGKRDVRRWARLYGVPLRQPDPFPFRTLKTMRAAVFCAAYGGLDEFTRAAFKLYWEEGGPSGADGDEDGPIREAARRAGLDPEAVVEGAGSPEMKLALRKATDSAVERGVFGAPMFFVGGKMFFGNDRLLFVEATLKNG